MALALREAVTNIVRHARARQCNVSFGRSDDGFLWLRVEDDGVGMDHAVALLSGGNGLRGMRERVQGMGGRFALVSEGPGTTLLIELSVANRAVGELERRPGLVEA